MNFELSEHFVNSLYTFDFYVFADVLSIVFVCFYG